MVDGRDMKKVYIAGPYTKGDTDQNVRNAVLAGDKLAQAGYAVFIPHLTLLWGLICPHDWKFWCEQDLHWLEVCDCLLRLPGESVGAALEVYRAIELEIPVYHSIEALLEGMTE